eukprot:gene213-382_t
MFLIVFPSLVLFLGLFSVSSFKTMPKIFSHAIMFKNSKDIKMSSNSARKDYGIGGSWKDKIKQQPQISSVVLSESISVAPPASISIPEEPVIALPSKEKIIVRSNAAEPASTSATKSKETGLVLKSNLQLAASAADAAKLSAISLAAIVSSVAEATVSFTRSDDAEESKKAAALAGNALSDAGKSTAAAFGAISNEWRNATKGLEDVEASDEFLKTMSTALQQIAASPELKSALGKAFDGLKRSAKEITNAYLAVVNGVGRELGTSARFKDSVTEAFQSIQLLLTTLGEILGRSVGTVFSGKELPPGRD